MNMFYLLAASEQNNDVRFWLFLTPYLSVTEFVLSVHEPCAKRSLNWYLQSVVSKLMFLWKE